MIVTNTNSTWPSRTSIIPGPRQRARKPTASSSACIRQCSTSSIASPSARRSIRPSPTCRPTLTPGWSNTTNSGPTRADTASAKHHFKPSLTPSQSPRKNPSSISRLNSLQPHDRRPASSCRPSDQVQTFTQDRIDPARLVFIDETWTKTNMAPLRGWSPLGQRLPAKVPHGRWTTMTFLAALRHDRVDAPWLIDGPINGDSFRQYIDEVLIPTLHPGDIVIMDNLGSHRSRAVRRALRAAGA